jgi:hypothetical protein
MGNLMTFLTQASNDLFGFIYWSYCHGLRARAEGEIVYSIPLIVTKIMNSIYFFTDFYEC